MRKGSYRNAEISRQHHRHHFSDRPDRRLRSVRADLLSTFHAHLEAPRAACQGLRSASRSRYGAAGARSVGRDRSGDACVSRCSFGLVCSQPVLRVKNGGLKPAQRGRLLPWALVRPREQLSNTPVREEAIGSAGRVASLRFDQCRSQA